VGCVGQRLGQPNLAYLHPEPWRPHGPAEEHLVLVHASEAGIATGVVASELDGEAVHDDVVGVQDLVADIDSTRKYAATID
jgi:hypothetical protein